MKNIIIVEGETDKVFLENYINYLNIEKKKFIEIDTIKDSKGQDRLHKTFNSLKISINTGSIKNIGVVLDADDIKIENKIDLINNSIEEVFSQKNVLKNINEKESIRLQNSEFNIFCYIINIDGKGELEDILKSIRVHKNTKTTECLDKYIDCIGGFNEVNPKKAYNKNFIYLYGYDCLKKDNKEFKKYTYYTKEYFNFENELLNDLKTFLKLFN